MTIIEIESLKKLNSILTNFN